MTATDTPKREGTEGFRSDRKPVWPTRNHIHGSSHSGSGQSETTGMKFARIGRKGIRKGSQICLRLIQRRV